MIAHFQINIILMSGSTWSC